MQIAQSPNPLRNSAHPPRPFEVPKLTAEDVIIIEKMQKLRYGRIENVPIRDGSPVTNDRSRILQSIGMSRTARDHQQKKPWLGRRPHRRHYELIAECRLMVTGVMDWIEVADGLPVSWEPRQHGRRRMR